MKKVEGDPLYAALRPERPAQVHHHHAEDVDVAVAERVDVVDDRINIYQTSYQNCGKTQTRSGTRQT